MNKKKLFWVMVLASISMVGLYVQSAYEGFKTDSVPTSQLSQWKLLGIGEVSTWGIRFP